MDYIHNAIFSNKEITFQYCEWNLKKELVPKKNGAMYVVSTWALTWDDENYYLVAYDDAAGKIKHYRIDKMQKTAVLESDRKGVQAFEGFNLPAFAKKTFGMYGGYDAEVALIGKKGLIGVIWIASAMIPRSFRQIKSISEQEFWFLSVCVFKSSASRKL